MGYLLPEIYQSICSEHDVKLPKTFIETGTFMGGVPHRVMETYGDLITFDEWFTIELGEEICQVASKRYKLFEEYNFDTSKFNPHTDEKDLSFKDEGYFFKNKLKLICGDSSQRLKSILLEIDNSICFWLDAHSGPSKYSRGDDDVPLLKELDVISNHHIKNHIIAIDDAHMFGKKQFDSKGNIICDYTDVTYERVKEKILSINTNYDVGIYNPYNMEMVLAIVN